MFFLLKLTNDLEGHSDSLLDFERLLLAVRVDARFERFSPLIPGFLGAGWHSFPPSPSPPSSISFTNPLFLSSLWFDSSCRGSIPCAQGSCLLSLSLGVARNRPYLGFLECDPAFRLLSLPFFFMSLTDPPLWFSSLFFQTSPQRSPFLISPPSNLQPSIWSSQEGGPSLPLDILFPHFCPRGRNFPPE